MSGPSIEARSSEDLELIRRLTTRHDGAYCVHTGSNVIFGFQTDLSIDETTTHSSSDHARMFQQELQALHRSPSNIDNSNNYQ